jgi:hypothetical protein
MTLRKGNGHIDPMMIVLGLLVFIIVAGTGFLIYAMYFHDRHPAEFFSTTVISKTVEPGGELEFYLDWCENSLVPREIHRTWRNSPVYTQPTTRPNPAPIPGEYTIGVTVVFDVNHFSNRTESFEVGPVTVIDPGHNHSTGAE